MNKADIVSQILQSKNFTAKASGYAYAPTNIALVKYWGKRDQELHLPYNSSLSVTLGCKGAFTEIAEHGLAHDSFSVNEVLIAEHSQFADRMRFYLDLFRPEPERHYRVTTSLNIPLAAGLASSACGYAALIQALDDLYGWGLSKTELSILARLGSGSACRSLWNGFVEWGMGSDAAGMDSHGLALPDSWPELRIGLHLVESKQKPVSSRQAMQRTVATAKLYQTWPHQAAADLDRLKRAIAAKDFQLLGETAEANAQLMHATMQDAVPAINYSLLGTQQAIEQVVALRNSGTPIYFTQDAGPNLKLLFLAKDSAAVHAVFANLEVIAPFADPAEEQVVVVDTNDRALDVAEKLTAHQRGELHRAFSVFILRNHNNKTELLLQQRHAGKYHCGGLWTNSCCSHPRPGEDIVSAAKRRLNEELGFTIPVRPVGSFTYRAEFSNGLIEHELDHVLVGHFTDNTIKPNPQEVQDYKWLELTELQQDLQQNPHNYTPWLAEALQIVRYWDICC